MPQIMGFSHIDLSVTDRERATTWWQDERRIGLDHLSFRVADVDELERWVNHLDTKGVAHSGIIDSGFGPTVVFRDPDNIQLELFVHPTSFTGQL